MGSLSSRATIGLDALHGTWFIQFTDFPMWLRGDRQNPAITYSALPDPATVRDEVTYTKDGKQKSIVGVDRHLGDTRFRWRGSGILYLLTSDWQVDYLAEDGSWLMISFERSLFTPKGHDILSRAPVIGEPLAQTMLEVFSSLHPDETVQRISQG